MSRYRNSNGLNVFLGVLGTLLALACIFCVVVCVMASCHEVTFAQEIANWFTAKPAPDTDVAGQVLRIIRG